MNWRSTETDPPREGHYVLVRTPSGKIDKASRRDGMWDSDNWHRPRPLTDFPYWIDEENVPGPEEKQP
jgi:hypothetical protein